MFDTSNNQFTPLLDFFETKTANPLETTSPYGISSQDSTMKSESTDTSDFNRPSVQHPFGSNCLNWISHFNPFGKN